MSEEKLLKMTRLQELGTRKTTGRVERWWITCNLMFDKLENGCLLYGEFHGLASVGLEDGKFSHKAGIYRIDFLERVVEFENCYVYLGAPNSIDDLLIKMGRPETGQTKE